VKYKDLLDSLELLKDEVAKKSQHSVLHLQTCQGETATQLVDEFEQFIASCVEESETFRFWDTFLHLVASLENLIRSDRDIFRYLSASSRSSHPRPVAIFAAFDSTNYLRWCLLYLEELKRLPETAPEVYSAFLDGRFAIK